VSADDEFAEEPMTADDAQDAGWVRGAEARRRAGRPEQARRLLEAGLLDAPYELSGRIVLALACLDLGDAEGARQALEPAVASWADGAPESLALRPAGNEPFAVQSDPLADLAENELERAFEHAESEPVEVWTTNRVAEAALRAVEESGPEGAVVDEPDSPFATETVAELLERQGAVVDEPDSPFATETVAELLERQGAPERASAIRRSLRHGTGAGQRAPGETERWVDTLEHWLDNLRRASR